MFHNLKSKFFKKYSVPATPLPQIWQDTMTLIDQNKYEELTSLYLKSKYLVRKDILKVIGDMPNFDNLEDYCNDNLENYVCLLIKGHIYMEQSKRGRGMDVATRTSQHQFELMNKYAQQANDALYSALRNNRNDKMVFQILINSFIYLGFEGDELEQLYQEAIQLEGTNFHLNLIVLNIKTPKWHGSQSELFGFIKSVCSDDFYEAANLGLVCVAHYEYHLYLMMTDKTSEAIEHLDALDVKNDIRSACTDFIEHAEINDETYYAASAFLYFAWKYSDKKMAEKLLQFTQLKVNFEAKPWFYEYGELRKYNALRYLIGR